MLSGDYTWYVNVLLSEFKPSDWIGQQVSCIVYDGVGSDRKSIREFTCVPEGLDFYPIMRDKPVIHGLQSAVVTGPEKGKPANDASVRVRIKFHWDLESGDKTSCWVRVAQQMVWEGYGTPLLPRTGQEVLVRRVPFPLSKPFLAHRNCWWNASC